MVNPLAGEVALRVNGRAHVAKLTLGALAEMEAALGESSLVDLAARFEAGRFSASDVMTVLVAGLRGGGWNGDARELFAAEIEEGPLGAARAAAQLLSRAFATP